MKIYMESKNEIRVCTHYQINLDDITLAIWMRQGTDRWRYVRLLNGC